ncbi:MAG TPA: hypothetical protein VMD09_12470 [Solirubrobacteraceae bacterium]|nr:hypothetical protein [Solirubrobacteraceae bacterium]
MPKVFAVIAAVACLLVLAACGSDSSRTGTTAQSDAALALARCMRANGVPNFPDPGPGGSDFKLNSEVNPQSPSFQAAQQACKRYLPSFAVPGTMSASQRSKALNFARCMRTHGEPDFPDPSVGTATPGVTGRVLALRGMFFEIGPGLDPMSPAFRQAAKDCGLRIGGSG